ncbi:MAG TPA: hypothetical protein VGQ40_07780, partial [Chthoniobacterales bacterium]|nr:hypothetical protein [Chthoniobacterales bacterium]
AVIVPPDAEPPPLGSRFPWEIQNTPGIHLQAHLKDVAFGSGNALNASLNFQAYSPLLNQWLIDHPGFDPVTGFSGGLAVTGSPKLLTIAALKLPRVDEILLTARGLGVTIPTASAALTNLMGASLPIPAEIHDQFADKFSLESAALFISAGDGASQPFKVEQIAVKLAFGRTVKVAGSAAGTLGFLADPFVGRAIGANVGPFAIDAAHNVLSITVDTTAVADIALPVGGTVTADQIVSALSGSPEFRAVAIAENIGEGVAIASGHEMTPQGWPFHAAATLTDLSVAVLNPFDDDARSIQSRIDGVFALTLGQGHFDLDIGLDIATRLGNGSGAGETTVEIHGEQRGTASVSLSELFHSQAIDGFGTDVSGFTPPQINLTELKFSVSPKTGAYAFSFAIEAGGSWQLGTDANGSSSSNADDHVSTVHFAIARTSGEPAQWQLQAESGNGVAIGALFQNLTNPALPAPLHDVLVKSFSISSTADEEGHTNGFKTECKGEIEIGDPPQTGTDPQPGPLEITVEFDHQSNPASNTFKAGIVLEGMAFDVILNKAQATTGDDSKPPAPVETSDSDTTSFELSNILSRVLPFEDASGLPDLKIS